MEINSEKITEKVELLNLIEKGINPLQFIKEESDIDFICNAITIEGKDEDLYFEEMAEILLKAILYYLIYIENEEKTLKRCKNIVEMVIIDNEFETVKSMLEKEERARVLFAAINIASEKNRRAIFEKLNDRLKKIL